MSGPAASCPRCSKPGIVSEDQAKHSGSSDNWQPLNRYLRFHCVCSNEWLANAENAEAMGRFLDRAGLRP